MKRLGPYKILHTIAMGGMGEVYLAALERAGGFEKQVALKCILPRLMSDVHFVELFEREARLAAVLSHRNIVQVFDFGREADRAWLAMEFVDGVDLKQVFDRVDSIPLNIVLDIGIQCALALHYAHRATDVRGRPLHIIHRDVSPQNVLLSYEGDVKLADFGLAHAAARGADDSGLLKGKFAYMSPEQALGNSLDERTDQFSLGVVLLELLTGERAFHDTDGTPAILQRVARVQTRVSLDDVDRNIPRSVRDCIERSMSLDRRDRFADSGKFAQALESAAVSAGLSTGSSNIGEWLTGVFPDRAWRHEPSGLTVVEGTAVATSPIAVKLAASPVDVTAFSHTPVSPLEETIDGRLPEVPLGEQTHETETNVEALDAKPWGRYSIFASILTLGLVLAWTLKDTTDQSKGNSAVTLATAAASSPPDSLAHVPVKVVPKTVAPISKDAQPTEASLPETVPDSGQGSPVEAQPSQLPDKVSQNDKQLQTPRKIRRRRRNTRKLKARPTMDRARVSSAPAKSKTAKRPSPASRLTTAINPSPQKAPLTTVKKSVKQVLVISAGTEDQKLLGSRLRIIGKDKATRIKGSKPIGSWYPIDGKGLFVTTKSGNGPRLSLRVRATGARFHATIHATPHGSVFVNKRSFGDTPIASAPIFPGRQVIRVIAPDRQETALILEIAQ